MKILITSDLFDASVNGVMTSVHNLEGELLKNGHEVKVLMVSNKFCSYKEGNRYYIKSVPSGLYPELRIPVSHCKDFMNELVEWKPDVVHSQCEFFTMTYAKRIANATQAVLVHTFHTLYEQYTEYLPIGKRLGAHCLGEWIQYRLRSVDAIIAPTRKVERTLHSYGVNQNIHIIPSGIQLKKYEKEVSEEQVKCGRRQYNIPENAHVLVSLGRLGAEKRIEELLYGLQRLLGYRKDVVLLIVGGGPAEEKLKTLAEELGLMEYVRFAGMVHPNQVGWHYKLGDIFVCASTSETQGLTYIEAMASGLPLVCRKDPCLYGVLEECGNGYSYETLEQFVDGILSLLQSEERLECAKMRSSEIVKCFSVARFGTKVESCYVQTILERECKGNENTVICEKSQCCSKKRNWESHGYARRIS